MLKGAPNFRDMGGVDCGRVGTLRKGRLLRSGVLHDLTADDFLSVAAYDVRLVCDLRSPDERAHAPNLWPPPDRTWTLTADGAISADAVRVTLLHDMLRDPAFDGNAARERMLDGYRRMPRLYADLLSRLFVFLATEDAGAALVHCVAGKDRTGFVCAMILAALGASRQAIDADYLESGARVVHDHRMLARLGGGDGKPLPDHSAEALSVLAGVDAAYLDAAFAAIDRRYGSIDAYLVHEAGLAAPLRERLRARLLIPVRAV